MNSQLNAPFSVPVALLGFNRPDLMLRQIETLRSIQPSHVLVVLDGPRPSKPGEAALCAQTADALKAIDWPCELEIHRAETNMGCRKRVSSGVSWVFSRVENAIILEDDCSPHPDFFPYAAELLERYRDDPRVMHISGFNPVAPSEDISYSYAFTRFPMIWGWASWRRAWQNYDETLSKWPTVRAQVALFRALPFLGYLYWNRKFLKIRKGFDTWDYQWTFACLVNRGLCVLPRGNLMTNLGFRADATHTTDVAEYPAFEIQSLTFPLSHPEVALQTRVNRAHLRSMWRGFRFLF
jgi:hypothetical protein